MAVDEGKFKLYTDLSPPLTAGEWRLNAQQQLKAQTPSADLDTPHLPVEEAPVHFRVHCPRYQLPPDQVLSTFPPANATGSFGNRLPQVVIKRRTLPWERELEGAPDKTPWLALVLIAQGEARLDTAVDPGDCVSEGVTLDGEPEVAKANRLVITKSMIDKLFPTREDVALLAHAREVDIHDTELMMGDDDGFLSVVVGNRLPVPGKDEAGEDVPIQYLACLVNLEGQFDLLPEPDQDMVLATPFMAQWIAGEDAPGPYDHLVMGTADALKEKEGLGPGLGPVNGPGPGPRDFSAQAVPPATPSSPAPVKAASPHGAKSQWSTQAEERSESARIAMDMAAPFTFTHHPNLYVTDPIHYFPVLLHWRFTTHGNDTFRSLMKGLGSKLLGDVPKNKPDNHQRNSLPLEVVESGHLGLDHRTREGDQVRAWYRSPLMPHPASDPASDRLDLAHSADQLRMVIPDGREDLSLATAFEIGRLLTLSQPAIIACQMRWRQGHYHAARLRSLLTAHADFWATLLDRPDLLEDLHSLGPEAGRFLVDAIAARPHVFLGRPRPRITPGRPLDLSGGISEILTQGLGLAPDILKGDIRTMVDRLRSAEAPTVPFSVKEAGTVTLRNTLKQDLNNQRLDLVSNTLSNKWVDDPLTGPAFPVTPVRRTGRTRDRLDRILNSPGPGAPIRKETP